MKYCCILLIFLLLLHPSLVAQQPRGEKKYFNRNFQQEFENEYVAYYGFSRKIGKRLYEVEFYNLNDIKSAVGEYKGKRLRRRHGLFVVYNPEGQILLSTTFQNNVGHGIYQRFFPNGLLADSGRLIRGNMAGTWKSWHMDGQLRELRSYELNRSFFGFQVSSLEKEFKSWFENGKLDDSGYYKQNRREGIWIDWEEKGNIRSVGMYKRDWKKGLWRYYDPAGKLLYMRRFSSFRYDNEGEYVPISR